MLHSPRAGVVGCRDLDAATAFFAAAGLRPVADADLSAAAAAMYGVGAVSCRLLESPATHAGAVLLVQAPLLPPPARGLALGGYAVDVYTRDRAASIRALGQWGAASSHVASYPLGPGQQMSELLVEGPDGARLVLIDTTARRPSALDDASDLLHSEASAFVLLPRDVEADLTFWRAAGLDLLRDDVLRVPGVPDMLGLEGQDTPLRLTLLWDEDRPSTRLELLSLPEGPQPADPGPAQLRCGLSAVVFDVDDLAAARDVLAGAEWQPEVDVDDAVHGRARLVAGTSPGGTPFLLSEQR